MRFERTKDRAQRKRWVNSNALSIRICAFEIPSEEISSNGEDLWKVPFEPQRS